jgi:hypothetical protein
MTKGAHIAMAGALLVGLGSGALAAGGLDGDNNPVPGASAAYASDVYAAQPAYRFHPAVRNEARMPRAAEFSGARRAGTVTWRDDVVRADPDPNIRLQLLRDAQDGEE